jgi:hypothetical protein
MHGGTDAAASVSPFLVIDCHSNPKSRRNGRLPPTLFLPVTITSPGKTALTGGSPAMSQNLSPCADRSLAIARSTMKRLGLNLRDLLRFNLSRSESGRFPYAVQSGVRFPAIAYPPGLCCRPLRTNPMEPTLEVMLPGVQGSAAPYRPIPWAAS